MSIQKTADELHAHKLQTLQEMETYLTSLITSEDNRDGAKADKLCYWLQDWMTFLSFENEFSPMSLRRYKRGEIIKVHLGFNVGSEEGGLHYAVVIDKNNPKSSPVITIVPLTSVKPSTDISKLRGGSIFLGNELFTNLNSKISTTERQLRKTVGELTDLVKNLNNVSDEELNSFSKRVQNAQDELNLLEKMKRETRRMNRGSIALVNQITTISKIRIYDPKTDHDILSTIKLSNEKLNLIDAEIQKKFTNL